MKREPSDLISANTLIDELEKVKEFTETYEQQFLMEMIIEAIKKSRKMILTCETKKEGEEVIKEYMKKKRKERKDEKV